MAELYLAHIAPDGRKQTLFSHEDDVAQLAQAFATPIRAESYARQMALVHDWGKSTAAWQAYLRRVTAPDAKPEASGPDHSTAGAQKLMELNTVQQVPAAMCVMGHHSGLPDYGGRLDGTSAGTFCGRRKKTMAELGSPDVSLCTAPLPPVPIDLPHDGFSLAFLTRMLYSCLTDADYLDTETFMQAAPRALSYDTMDTLRHRLKTKIDPWLAADGQPMPAGLSLEEQRQSALNRRRNQILRACLSAGEGEKDLYTLTVPTGGGKTIASLAFALTHTEKHPEMQHIIYVIPYTSIIEQNADVFRDILGDGNVLEHHSGMDYSAAPDSDRATEDPQKMKYRLAAENWDAPVTVTTNVQFFESLYACRSSRCRKLHNIMNSVVIFDEVQMLPLDNLQPCVRAIEELVRRYGVTAVLCTATQPALGPLFSPDMHPRDIVANADEQYRAFRRCTLRQIGRQNPESLAEQMEACGQALCIVNRRETAQKLYALLPQEGRFHLSTLMTPKDRRVILKTVRARLEQHLPCFVASTSLVEAGVDFDFPAVFREEAGLDSILQAAGRCNREGKRPASDSLVSVFSLEQAPPQEIQQYVSLLHEIEPQHPDLADPSTVEAYFNHLHAFFQEHYGRSGLDHDNILGLLAGSTKAGILPLRTVGETFRIIRQKSRQLLIPQDDTSRQLARTLEAGVLSRQLMRQAAPYLVSVYPENYAAYTRCAATEVAPGLAVLEDMRLYRRETGLAPAPPEGQATFC